MRTKSFALIAMLLYILAVQAQTSKVNVTIDGPGVVDEYLTTSADGKKQVRLKAIPSKFLGNVTFDGWSGDASGNNTEITVSADKAQNIQATFTYHRPVKKYSLPNLKQSWEDMGKLMYCEMPKLWENQDNNPWRGCNYLPVDYNRDGYLDYVFFAKKGGMGIDNHREKVRFWLGKPDGSFEEDPKNDNRIVGTVYSVHLKYADFNDDGYPDFCSFSTGYDREGSTYDYPVILMSGPDGVYTDLRFEDFGRQYFHGGAVGDIDNDGDIDVIYWRNFDFGHYSLLLINDGKGNFTQKHASEIIDFSEVRKLLPEDYNYPIIHGDIKVTDLNNDGYNDLCFTGQDYSKSDGSNWVSGPMILWGSSSGKFGGSNYSLLPKCREGYSINEDFCFYDLNGDGRKEIIVERCGDGLFGGTRFYIGGYLQVCEWENGQYVDKTAKYIPVEHQAFNKYKTECRTWIENIDGTDYLFAVSGGDDWFDGFGEGASAFRGFQKVYAIRNGIMEPVISDLKTKIPSFDEGLPIYVDGPRLTDYLGADDGVNPVDTMAEHAWVAESDWDGVGGNMWRINLHHREGTHFGRTCIRWNRDGLDPKKIYENQTISFEFMSNVDIQYLIDNDYYLEFYIKNSDPDLSLIINGTSVDVTNTDEAKFTGEWQRMLLPLRKSNFTDFNSLVIEVDKGDLNNEFYLDDIRIRRLAKSEGTEYDRAFLKSYLDASYMNKERTAQVGSQEFKAMLKQMVEKFGPDSMNYFNRHISDENIPLTRNIAVGMVYYTAKCIGADEVNRTMNVPELSDEWEGAWDADIVKVLPLYRDKPASDAGIPEDKYWLAWEEIMQAYVWNNMHVSPYSNKEVIECDRAAKTFHMREALVWEDAICAITRLYDSMDPAKIAAGISTLRITPDYQSGVYYNLQGQRVENPVKGIYIKNGKKMIYK